MKKEFNYTDRLEIPSGMVTSSHVQNERSHILKIEWDFSSLGFEVDDQIVCDVFVSASSESLRFDLGLVADGKASKELDIFSMRNPLASRIRLKVINKSTGLPIIRGVIDNFYPTLPEDSDSARSLLPILRKADLKTPWELNFDRGIPSLYITDQGNLYKSLKNRVKAEWFFPTIMHKVIEDIFMWIATTESFENAEKIDKWKSVFIDHYNCPRDFFDAVEEKDGAERRDFAKDQSRLIAEAVCFKNRDVKKLSEFFEGLEGE